MKVSVIINNYNTEKYIKRAITSVLQQTYKNYEIIVVDDCSKDKSLSIIKKYKKFIKIIEKKNNTGLADSRNVAIKVAKGDLVCFLDADDYWMKRKLEKQISYVKKYKNVGIFCNNIYSINNNTILTKRFNNVKVFQNKKKSGIVKNYIRNTGRYAFHVPSITMFRKKLFLKYGFFNNTLRSGEDSELILRLIINGEKIYYNDEALGYYETGNQDSLTKDYEKWIKYHFLYWINLDFSSLMLKDQKKFIKMRSNTLLNSLFLMIKNNQNSLVRKLILKNKKILYGYRVYYLFLISFLPIYIFIKSLKKIIKK